MQKTVLPSPILIETMNDEQILAAMRASGKTPAFLRGYFPKHKKLVLKVSLGSSSRDLSSVFSPK